MDRIETELGGEPRAFPSTLWTLVLQASGDDTPARRAALQSLLAGYWKPIYYFIRRRGRDREAAKDLTQGFFTALLERDGFRRVDPALGKFRTFLLSSLQHYLSDEYDRDRALKRGGGVEVVPLDLLSEDQEASSVLSEHDPDAVFRREWALSLLSRALDNLKSSMEAEGRRDEFDAFKGCLSMDAETRSSYAQMAGVLGVEKDDVRGRLHVVRKRYAEHVLDLVRATTASESEAREELRDLLQAFA